MPMGGKSYGDGESKIVVPSQTGQKGLPPGVGSGKKPQGIVVPSQTGDRGKPHKQGFPNTPPARD